MDSKKGLLIAAVAAGAYLLTRKGAPTFYNMNGQPITEALCGSSMTFDVPGYSRVWLSQLKNGTLHYDGPFNLPMPAYVLSCTSDVGTYEIAVYEIDANDVKGVLIGQTTFTILPQA